MSATWLGINFIELRVVMRLISEAWFIYDPMRILIWNKLLVSCLCLQLKYLLSAVPFVNAWTLWFILICLMTKNLIAVNIFIIIDHHHHFFIVVSGVTDNNFYGMHAVLCLLFCRHILLCVWVCCSWLERHYWVKFSEALSGQHSLFNDAVA